MKTIKAIIIDDEKHAREGLLALLELYCPEVKVIAKASNIKDAKEIIEQLYPDLVFLDIEIGEDTGFDLLEILDPFNFQLIFTTAYSDFAIKAFRVNALDYLLKPIEPSELQTAIKKVKQNTNYSQLQHQISSLAQVLHAPTSKLEQLSISTIDGILFLTIENIIHIEGSGNYSTFFIDGGEKVLASKALSHYESLLSDLAFYRCHQSHLVNLHYIKKILTKEGNMIELKDGAQVPIARKRKEELLIILSKGIKR